MTQEKMDAPTRNTLIFIAVLLTIILGCLTIAFMRSRQDYPVKKKKPAVAVKINQIDSTATWDPTGLKSVDPNPR